MMPNRGSSGSNNRSRFQSRQEEIRRQEELLLLKKREIEARLNSASQGNSTDRSGCSTTIVSASTSPRQESSMTTTTSAVPSPTPVVNKFENNGSFLELFRKMQESGAIPQNDKGKNEDEDTEKGSLPVAGCSQDPQPTSSTDNKTFLNIIERCAVFVAINGRTDGEQWLSQSQNPQYQFLQDKESVEYQYFQKRVAQLTRACEETQDNVSKSATATSTSISPGGEEKMSDQQPRKKRKSRWGEQALPMDADLIQYAMQVYGTVELEEHQWRQLEDQRKMRVLTVMMKNRTKQQKIKKNKYDYDSDEEVDPDIGTWEHQRRLQEMEKTKEQAEFLNSINRGKHHIGDFLPPDELEKFLQKWDILKDGKADALMTSDYEKFKLDSSNKGYQLLQQMGWKEGEGLGPDSSGITEPINKAAPTDGRGLGQSSAADLKKGDDEYEAYRKRMMMAYRFRPNPLNNPRRAYY